MQPCGSGFLSKGLNIHNTAKSIGKPLQIIGFRCSNHLHGHSVYKIKHLGMQTASTNICERMGRSQGSVNSSVVP
ncbi:unnamed protein product [Staurois parvus]|uniref:Uncharacterized protein n=1 Tax=Staurois parvus TaxID=386267 RepID=A0ABN9BYW7_9NEOB|nr:unnamed protein product [Staurois parvus]